MKLIDFEAYICVISSYLILIAGIILGFFAIKYVGEVL